MPAKKENAGNLQKKNNRKTAFVISPIGEPDSLTRKRADQILNFVIEPVVSKMGYKAIRADKTSKPGVITSQIIDHLLNDSLVIADLTGQNANVFYELAVRHAVRKPVIQMIQEGDRIPFDVSTTRTIKIDHKDLESVDKAKKELKGQIEAAESDWKSVDSPISIAVDLQTLRQSSNPEGKAIAGLRTALQEISFMVKDIHSRIVAGETEVIRAESPDIEFRLDGVRIGSFLMQKVGVSGGQIKWRVIDEETDAYFWFRTKKAAIHFINMQLPKEKKGKTSKRGRSDAG